MATISRVFPRFENKWVMVTAPARLRPHARQTRRRRGANIVVHYNNSKAGAEKTAEAVRALGREAIVVQADIKSWDQIKAMIATAWEKTGGIDVLMNNVATSRPIRSIGARSTRRSSIAYSPSTSKARC